MLIWKIWPTFITKRVRIYRWLKILEIVNLGKTFFSLFNSFTKYCCFYIQKCRSFLFCFLLLVVSVSLLPWRSFYTCGSWLPLKSLDLLGTCWSKAVRKLISPLLKVQMEFSNVFLRTFLIELPGIMIEKFPWFLLFKDYFKHWIYQIMMVNQTSFKGRSVFKTKFTVCLNQIYTWNIALEVSLSFN